MSQQYKKMIQEKRKRQEFLEENLGNDLINLLNDNSIIEIMLNQDSYIWIEKFGIGLMKTDISINPLRGKQIIELVASYDEKNITRHSPIVSTILPNGERFEGILYEPVDNKPIFAIRKRSKKIYSLDEYLDQGVISSKQKDFITKSIENKENILVVGGTSTGKTTFVNACIKELDNSDDRIFFLEDTRELQSNAKNINFLVSTENVDLTKLVKSCMRLNPDRIIVGELRGGSETLALLKAWNSGHQGGLSTIHANSVNSALKKVEQYLAEITSKNMNSLIANTINVIVCMVKENNKRFVKSIAKVIDYDKLNDKYILKEVEYV